MRVLEVMSRAVVTCTEFCTAETAATLLRDAEYGVLPVLNGRDVVGVVTERSICLRVVAQRCDPAAIPVLECMDSAPLVCHSEQDAYAVLARIAQSTARGAIVVDGNNELEGVLPLAVLAMRVATAARELYAALSKVNGSKSRASGAA